MTTAEFLSVVSATFPRQFRFRTADGFRVHHSALHAVEAGRFGAVADGDLGIAATLNSEEAYAPRYPLAVRLPRPPKIA
jgi:hypothetical protein